MDSVALPLIACPICGQIQHRPAPGRGQRLHCARCGKHLPTERGGWTPLIAATVALIVMPLAMLLPIMRIERLGLSHETGIVGGVAALADHGQWFLALVVLFFSVLLPAAKLLGLIVLLLPRLWRGVGSPVRQRWIYEAVEASGRWGMVDVLLVAVLVAIVKLGDLVTVTAGPGIVAFAVMVAGSMIAGLSLHPHELWDIHPGMRSGDER
jgi:paraquat-inducible protein A